MDASQGHYHLIPYIVTGIALVYSIYTTLKLYTCCKKRGRCNTEIRLNEDKIVHSFDIEDLDSKSVYCRCWKSKKFPYCDGSHNEHNRLTNDNVGPLIIKKKEN